MSDETPVFAAEQMVLGQMLLSATAVEEARVLLEVGDFTSSANAVVWEAIGGLFEQGAPVDPVAVANHIGERDLRRIGGAPYLHTLVASVGPVDTVAHYAGIVKRAATLRRLDAGVRRIHQLAMGTSIGDDVDLQDLLGRAQRLILDVTETENVSVGPVHWAAVAREAHGAIDDIFDGKVAQGIPTGLYDLDLTLGGGLRRGELTIVGGRPGAGKSVFLANAASHAAFKLKIPTLMLSMEMSRVDLHHRLTASGARIPLHVLNSGDLSEDDFCRMAKYAGETAEAPLWIDQTETQTLATISQLARAYKRHHDLQLLLIDYIQLTSVSGPDRQAALAELSRGLKRLAASLNIAILAAAQLNREAGQSDKPPQMHHLGESSSLEANAAVVILTHIPPKDSVRQGEADLHIAKNRFGATDIIPVAAQLHLAKFASMVAPPDVEPAIDPASAAALSKGLE